MLFSYAYEGQVYVRAARIGPGMLKYRTNLNEHVPVMVHPEHPRWAFLVVAFVDSES